MPGRKCPKCGEQTLFSTPTGFQCTKCKTKVKVSPNDGKGGKGAKCPICRTYTVFNNKCSKCGARVIPPPA